MAGKTKVAKVAKVVKRGPRSKDDYKGIRAEAMKPISERKEVVQGREGKKIARRYSMKDSHAADLRKEFRDTGKFPNPYRGSGIYGACVQALILLGIDKRHPFTAVKAKVKELMQGVVKEDGDKKTNAWKEFVDREPRNKETGKDADGRLIQTFSVLQRITGFHPYGEKLRQLSACIDITRDADGLPEFTLHTGFANYDAVKPTHEGAKRGRKATGKAKDAKKAPAKKPAAKPKKATKPVAKPKAKAPKVKVTKVTEVTEPAAETPAEAPVEMPETTEVKA